MNTAVTSKDAILRVCRRIAAQQGVQALNMRLVAGECHIALGTLYNYFADKDALVLAAVESIWREIFHPAVSRQADTAFCDYVAGLYACIQKGAAAYPGFLTGHAIGIAAGKRGEAKSVMEHTVAHIRAGLLEALRADRAIPEKAFSPAFPREAFAGFVLDSMLLLLVQGQPDCSVLLEIIRRTVSPQTAAAQVGPLQEPAPGPAGPEHF